jgi:hypothetical protein
MKKFVGKRMEFVIEGYPRPVVAKVVQDAKDIVRVRGNGDKADRYIPKSKICSFMPLDPIEEDNVNLLVLFCENPTTGCPGVQMVKDGHGFTQRDLNVFMAPCGSRCGTCRTGSRGEIRTISPSRLKEMFDGTMFGDYPEGENQ